MNIDELTIGQAKELACLVGSKTEGCGVPFVTGQAYLIRTVTMAWTGRVRRITGGFLVLDDAAWIADLGRYNEAVASGSLSEVEPVKGSAFVASPSIVDAVEWKHGLPKEVK